MKLMRGPVLAISGLGSYYLPFIRKYPFNAADHQVGFSNFDVQTYHQRVFLKYKFRFSASKVGSEILHFQLALNIFGVSSSSDHTYNSRALEVLFMNC